MYHLPAEELRHLSRMVASTFEQTRCRNTNYAHHPFHSFRERSDFESCFQKILLLPPADKRYQMRIISESDTPESNRRKFGIFSGQLVDDSQAEHLTYSAEFMPIFIYCLLRRRGMRGLSGVTSSTASTSFSALFASSRPAVRSFSKRSSASERVSSNR